MFSKLKALFHKTEKSQDDEKKILKPFDENLKKNFAEDDWRNKPFGCNPFPEKRRSYYTDD